jgi:hypothetical protein
LRTQRGNCNLKSEYQKDSHRDTQAHLLRVIQASNLVKDPSAAEKRGFD